MRDATTETDYARELDLLRSEINTAIECFYTYLEIHRFAAESPATHKAMNEHANFWNINLYSLQATFFLTIGRVFDDGRDSHSIHKLLTATVAHPEFFSKASLSRRRQAAGVKPDWLDDFIANAYEPTVSELRDLKKVMGTHRAQYDATYADIRNLVFAHKISVQRDEVDALFGRTIISDADEMLYGLYDMICELWQLLNNGRKPRLGQSTYDYKTRIKASVRDAMSRLLTS